MRLINLIRFRIENDRVTIERYAHRVALITSSGQLLVGDKAQLMTPEVMAKAYQVR